MADASKYAVRDFLRSVKFEGMKVYRVIDGQGRVTYQYDAPQGAKDGDLCMRTEYAYSGSSFNVVQMLETLSNWSASWDLLS